MTDPLTYNPKDTRWKSPYGAVAAGTAVTFTLTPLRAAGFSRALLTARLEQRGDELLEVELPWTGHELGRDRFTGTLNTGDYVGLLWYSFTLERLDGRREKLGEYQLTVYSPAWETPAWFGEGVTYQIFPDRFCRLSLPDPAGMVGGRTVHENWLDCPDFRPNEKGEVRNRDFFGGSLRGVEEKLDYLSSLGVETIYFCPIFEGAENHRYGTADYHKIDPMLGTEEDFSRLCRKAHDRGIRIMLDGVFNHTGYVSRYFNGDGFYADLGAAQSQDSPYYSWFRFRYWPEDYEAWWGIYSLPSVEENDPSYRDFIFGDKDSVVRRWLRAGADGWRLDVADELPDDFVAGVYRAAREEKPEAVTIGEVWEDGTTKIAYGVRRRHLLGGHLDGLMNYPFRTALLDYLLGGKAEAFRETMETLRENYPPAAFYSAMNALGTHDTLRVLTLLGVGSERKELSKEERSAYVMTEAERAHGLALLRLGAAVLFTFPGSPTVYYGDEAGMEGFEDPFNRRCYPWGGEDKGLVDYFARLGNLRKTKTALRRGAFSWEICRGGLLSFRRRAGEETVLAAVNRGNRPRVLEAAWAWPAAADLLTGRVFPAEGGRLSVTLPGKTALLLEGRTESE